MSENFDKRSQQRFENFRKALKLYEEAVSPNLSRLEQEGMIHRFEFTFELAWKCLQDLLQERGYVDVRGPRPVIERAFHDGLISEGPLWMQMLKARNETTHLYDGALFEGISKKVRELFLPVLQNFKARFPK